MAKKNEQPTMPEAPKPVMAVEYNGQLYPTLQSAEAARAKADLLGVICPARGTVSIYDHGYQLGKTLAIDEVILNAEDVHGILSRYLDSSKFGK